MSEEELLRVLNEEALRLARNTGSPLRRLRLRLGPAAVDMEWSEGAPPVPPAPPRIENGESAGQTEQTVVRSPMVGTFYHAPGPGEPPFVSVGGMVEPDTVVGIVEAMKLMNRITADQTGVVQDVLVPDGHPVEFEQPLLMLDPPSDQDWMDR